jgi:hypothetical protein
VAVAEAVGEGEGVGVLEGEPPGVGVGELVGVGDAEGHTTRRMTWLKVSAT